MITREWHPLGKEPPSKRQVMPVIFTEEDDEGIVFPYNNVDVVALNVENYNVHHILINNESLADVLYYDAFIKMEISLDRLIQMDFFLVGFTKDAIQVERMIFLTVRIGNYPYRSIN